ncbi:ABC transporter permease [Stenotrophomonas mori]|uniref:ABC transporter permease n=1 Tax=Stenotrophomonas mori TaxID=2871096 RepID=A0ABT0SJY3_9GAMM|nr:ABC transporter permease [Stenotrophomonas mori]MCL7715636.1 ABC transporter permease [Stenotrophomonas mori]
MKRVAATFRATLRAVFADSSARAVMIGAVLLYSFFYPAAYRHQVASDLPIAVVDADRSATSRDLVRHLDALRAVRVVAQPADLGQARAQLEAGQVDGIVLIPARLERDILRGGSGQLVLLGNGAYLSRASAILNGLAEGIIAFARGQAVRQAAFMGPPQAAPLELVQRPLYNTREGYGSSVVPGVAELIVHQTLLLGIGVLLGSRRAQLGRRLHIAPAQLLAMAAAFLLVALAGLLYYAGFGAWVQDYPRGGNVPGLLLAALLFAAATVAFGLFVGSFFTTRERAFQYVTAVSIPLFFLSNLSWPALASPPALVALAKLLPTTAGINAIVRTQQMGARLPEVGGELCTLLLLALLYGGLALWRFRRDPGSSPRR